jgi:hypothetical protein
MKLKGLIVLIVILCSGLMGCANPMVIKIDEDSQRITGLAQVAKTQLEDCLLRSDKSACEEVDTKLDEIIATSNGLPDIVKGLKAPFQK